MEIYIITFSFLFGLIIGSFLNVVIYRYNTGISINGRSGCLSCGKKLSFFELIPVLSFLLLRGKCKGCKSKVSWQYPLVELSTGIIFSLIVYKYINDPFILLDNIANYITFAFIIFAILIVIFVYDLRHKIIPDALVYSFAGLSLLYRIYETNFNSMNSLAWFDLFSGVILFLPFFILWIVSKGTWIGLGDGKLALGIGWLLGFIGGVSAIILAFWIGALICAPLVLISKLKPDFKHITRKTEVPFAPFLIIGLVIVFFFPIDVFSLSLFFSL